MNKEEVQAELRGYIGRVHKTQTAAAAHWGVSVVWVNKVLNGHRSPTKPMLDDIGVERVEPPSFYRRKKRGAA